ncbi:E3 ubiquitin-protein ligase RBBP6 [Apostichopus japonicus]|uniref:E3 ubiquitin-protein ligase RBBP6 n=1 Tax=Stichopus japonicus TaxID=307972 RepID=A0A2G8L6N9_STIJA|nr:E3 ubiquitin-protein ligase RBBP6 [Apostichopus japonicus]
MASVHYKFKSQNKYDTVIFDGLHISLAEFKKSIMDQQKLNATEFDLQVTNAQTGEEYKQDDAFIPKNASVQVRRIPVGGVGANITGEPTRDSISKAAGKMTVAELTRTSDLASANADENSKILAMVQQSGQDYDPKYIKNITACECTGLKVWQVTDWPQVCVILVNCTTLNLNVLNSLSYVSQSRGPGSYTCFNCGKPGHIVKACPLNKPPLNPSYARRQEIHSRFRMPGIKPSSGIPQSFMRTVSDRECRGHAHSSGHMLLAYAKGKKERPPFVPGNSPEPIRDEIEIPQELVCVICGLLMKDAVVIPCCGKSFCDECIRTTLLETENHQCPSCKEVDVSPDSLVPNKSLRETVMNFQTETGYNPGFRKRVVVARAQDPVLS